MEDDDDADEARDRIEAISSLPMSLIVCSDSCVVMVDGFLGSCCWYNVGGEKFLSSIRRLKDGGDPK